MGMTIEDHIEVLKSYNHGFTGYAGNLQDSIDVAIKTMHKYQKIEEIVNDRYGKPVFKTLDEVIKVVEDGDDDN